MDIDDLRKKRGQAADAMETAAAALTALDEVTAPEDGEAHSAAVAQAQADFDSAEAAFDKADKAVATAEKVERAKAKAATAADTVNVPGPTAYTAPAAAQDPRDKGIEVGFIIGSLAATKGDPERAARRLEDAGHSGPAAVLSGVGDSVGGVAIPQPLAEQVIDLLRPKVVVRRAGAETAPMPAGQMRYARLASGASASYEGETAPIQMSEQSFDAVDQSFKKLTAMVGLSNDLIRQATPAMARIARNDLVRQMGAREDIAFIRNDGTNGTPKGLRHWCLADNWGTEASATVAAVEAFLRSRVSLVEDADVAMMSPGWVMRASVKNFLANLRDGAGHKVYPSIDNDMTLHGFPIYTTSQIPNNLGAGSDTEIYFADFSETMIGDAMSLTVATSDVAAFVDAGGNTKSAFQDDLTIMRAISEHDFAPMHDAAISGGTVTGWGLT